LNRKLSLELSGNTSACHVIVNIFPLYFSFNLLPLSAQIAKRVIRLAGGMAGASGTKYMSPGHRAREVGN